MSNIAKIIEFVQSEIEFHERKQSELAPTNQWASQKHQETASNLTEVLNWIVDNKDKSESQLESDLFYINPLELDDLPEELRKELSVSDSDLYDAQVLELLRIAKRPISLNELMIALYRKYEVQHKRAAITARLYRLVNNEQIASPVKGTYTLPQYMPDPIVDLFGDDADEL